MINPSSGYTLNYGALKVLALLDNAEYYKVVLIGEDAETGDKLTTLSPVLGDYFVPWDDISELVNYEMDAPALCLQWTRQEQLIEVELTLASLNAAVFDHEKVTIMSGDESTLVILRFFGPGQPINPNTEDPMGHPLNMN